MSSPKTKLIIKYHRTSPDINPILITFPQNNPPDYFMQENQDHPTKKLKFDIMQNTNPHQNHQKIVAAKNGSFQFLGQNFGEYNPNLSNVKYLIGVRSKDKIEMFDIQGLYELNQYSDQVQDQNISQNNITNLEKKQNLVEEFGTKKSKKKLAQMLSNMVEENNINQKSDMKEFFEQKKQELQNSQSNQPEQTAEQLQLEDKRQFLPAFDLQATEPSKIYDIYSIINQQELKTIDPEIIMIYVRNQFKLEQDKKMFSNYVYYLLKQDYVVTEKDSQKLKFKAQLCHYIDVLVKMYSKRTLQGDLESLAQKMHTYQVVIQNVVKNFFLTTQNQEKLAKYTRNSSSMDKFICYMIVVHLFISDFKFNCTYLAQCLRINPDKFIQYCKEVGCSIKTGKPQSTQTGTQVIATLKAPLQIQYNRPNKQKGKK